MLSRDFEERAPEETHIGFLLRLELVNSVDIATKQDRVLSFLCFNVSAFL